MFAKSLPVLWYRRKQAKFALGVIFSLLVITTLNIARLVAVNYGAFIKYRESRGVDAFFENEWPLILPLQTSMLSRLSLLAGITTTDAFIIWRLYFVWPRWWIVAAPIAFLITESTLAIGLCIMSSLHAESIGVTFVCGFSAIMVNLLCTPLIAGRLRWLGRRSQPRGTRELCNTIVVRLIESGSLYTFSLIIYMTFTLMPGYFGVSTFLCYVFTMVVAIAPMLLVLRLKILLTSEMNVIDFDASERGPAADGKAPPPPRSAGVVSTTIAFNAHPQTLSFRPGQLESPTTSGISSRKSVVLSYQEKGVDTEMGPTVDVIQERGGVENDDDVLRQSKHADDAFDASFGLLYRVA
ncbi:hypothetical protein FRB94_004963 [Tulasnella sp. JGI-2019a]|nr:hypothetical protein FRB94_004963 [Tulasnella sp. JGI-2019a]KAG9029188.1 hypothetical protein FRB95_005602 [Tulasnella sp. JGI-2019a]